MATLYDTYDNDDFSRPYGTAVHYGQSFATVANSYVVTSIEIEASAKLSAMAGGVLSVQVYAALSGLPVGTAIAWGSTDLTGFTTVVQWIGCALDQTAPLVSGAQYAFMFMTYGTSTANVLAARTDWLSPTYTGGNNLYSGISNTAISNVLAQVSEDMSFRIWGVPAGTTHYPTGAISGVSYLSEAGWSATRYCAGVAISAVSYLTVATPKVDRYFSVGISATSYITARTPRVDMYATGAISGVSYLSETGWSARHYASGSISGVSYLSSFAPKIERWFTGDIDGQGTISSLVFVVTRYLRGDTIYGIGYLSEVSLASGVTHLLTGAISAIAYISVWLNKQANWINIVSNISAAPHHTRDGSDGLLVKGGVESQGGYFTDAGVGQTITFTAQDGRTVTVNKGIVIAIS